MRKKGLDINLDLDATGIDVGTDLHDIVERSALVAPYGRLQYSQGVGPWAVADAGYVGAEATCAALAEDIGRYGGAFIGECGLDYHWMYGTKEDQVELFSAQIDLSNSLGLPIIIHSRNADDDILRVFRTAVFSHGGIMHCFSSDWLLAKAALDKGLMISFSGNVTYKANTMIQEAASMVPADMILYETDSPYLAPVPFRGRPSNPGMADITAEHLAKIRRMDPDEFKSQVLGNFSHLLSLSSKRRV